MDFSGQSFLLSPPIGLAPHSAAAQQKKAPVRTPGIYASFDTSMGSFLCELYEKQAPAAVANFVVLVEGTKEWLNTVNSIEKLLQIKINHPHVTLHNIFLCLGHCLASRCPTRA